jgi:hypothetical protein
MSTSTLRGMLTASWVVGDAEDDFLFLISVETAASVDDEIRKLPRSFGRHIGVLLDHPAHVRGGRGFTSGNPRGVPRLTRRLWCLHPNDDVEFVSVIAPTPRSMTRRLFGPHRRLACADTLDDHKVTITVERDRTVSAPTNPGRRPVVQRLPITQHRQYVVGQQLVPAEHPVVPGEVVGVQHRTLRQRVSEPPRQAGLAAGAGPLIATIAGRAGPAKPTTRRAKSARSTACQWLATRS